MVRVRVSIGPPRCPVGGAVRPVRCRCVDALFVAASGVAGVVAGAVLDPLGQRLADLSRAAEQRDRAERDARRAAQAADRGDRRPFRPRRSGSAVGTARRAGARRRRVPAAAYPAGAADEAPPVRHLLPSGRSAGRTVGAALVTGGLWAATAAHFGHPPGASPRSWCSWPGRRRVGDRPLPPARPPSPDLRCAGPHRPAAGGGVRRRPHLARPGRCGHRRGAAAFGVFFLIWFFVPKGMGFGDVRLAGVIGLTVGYLSLLHAYLAFLSGFILGLLLGLVFMVGATTGRKTLHPVRPGTRRRGGGRHPVGRAGGPPPVPCRYLTGSSDVDPTRPVADHRDPRPPRVDLAGCCAT